MPEITVTLDEDEIAFIDEHDLSPTEMLRLQLGRERDRIRRNNPDPALDEEVEEKLRALVASEASDDEERFRSFMSPIGNAPVSIHGMANGDGSAVLRLLATFDRLPADEASEQIENNPFLAQVAANINAVLADSGLAQDAASFELVEVDEQEHEYDRLKAKYSATVSVEQEN